jgi:hypothetical protein
VVSEALYLAMNHVDVPPVVVLVDILLCLDLDFFVLRVEFDV